MILTTTTKQPYTTTGHNNNGYIFTLYLFMLLCVVCNCLLFYCSCTGNCENCCGINGLLRIANIDQDGKIDGNKILHTLFVNGEYKASVNVSIYRGSTEKDYKAAKKEFMDKIDTTCKTHLSAYVEVGDTARYFIHYKDANSIKDGEDYYNGLFHGSAATKIEILSCGSKIENMSYMFYKCISLKELDLSRLNTENVTNMNRMFDECNKLTKIIFPDKFNTSKVTNMNAMFGNCISLTNLNLSNFNTDNVKDMRFMFFNCSVLTELDLSNFNTSKVENMTCMFYNCISLNNLDLSNFNTENVKDMSCMFENCFTEKQTSTLICKASTIQNITEKENSYLIITNENKNEIKKTLNKNLEQVYKCSVKRGESEHKPQITSVVESNKADLFKLKDIPKSGKIDGTQIVRKEFVKLVKYVPIVGNEYDKQIIDEDSFMASIALTGQTYLSTYVEVKDKDTVKLRCFIHCTNANSIGKQPYYGLFQWSEATEIVIIRCGSKIENMINMFSYCSSLTELDLSKFNTQNVTDMSYMFYNCTNLTNIKFSDNFNTNTVKDMKCMFYYCTSLTNINLSNFNTTNVTDMSYMFGDCRSLKNLDLSKFNTDKVTDMYSMFSYCRSLTNIKFSNNFNTSKVTDMSYMFFECNKLTHLNLSNFNTQNVTNIGYIFYKCFKEEQPSTLICQASTIQKITENENSYLAITNKKKTKINNIIENNKNPKQVYTCTVKRWKNEDKPQITEIEEYKIKNIQSDGKVDDIQIVDANFAGRINYVQICSEKDKQELDKIKESINTTGETYLSAYVEVKKNDNVVGYFIHCTNANSINETPFYYGLFQDIKAIKIVILSCGSEIKNMRNMFLNCSSLTKINFHDNFNTINVTDMRNMFNNCSSLKELDLSKFNTNNVTDMQYMFANCSSLKNINLSKFNTDNVTNMSGMFSYCSSLTELNLSKFNTNNVTDMGFMFNNCSSLTNLDLSNFNTDNVTNMLFMFWGCSSLTNLDLSKFNTDTVKYMNSMFSQCFKEKKTSTLICQASTIKKITDKGGLCLINAEKEKNRINDILNKNTDRVYKCTVKRVGSNPEITEVEEYQSQK